MSVIRARSKVTVPTVLRADIQGLRAIAVLAVVAFHAALPVPGGFVGVDIFFVISGFVITVMLEREWRETGKVSFGRFYLRRFKRLTPALAMMIAITVILSAVIVSPLGLQQTTAKTAVGGIFLMANLVIAKTVGGYFDAVAGTNPLLHTWSLSVEEQFHLVFPALLVLGWIIARSRRRWAPHVIVAGLGASSLAVMLAPTAGLRLPGSESLWGFYSPLTRAWEFAAGALLALVLTHRSLTGTTATLTGTVGLGLVAASLTLIGEDTTFPGVWTALPVAGTLLLLAGGSDPAAPLSRLLSRGAMVGIGDWSYSIYLWHWPLIVFAGFLWGRNTVALTAAAALALVPALVSYTRLEQPLRNLGPPRLVVEPGTPTASRRDALSRRTRQRLRCPMAPRLGALGSLPLESECGRKADLSPRGLQRRPIQRRLCPRLPRTRPATVHRGHERLPDGQG